MTWTDEGQDNRVHKDAVETIEKVIKAAKTILADEFAIQQMEYDELYGVNSKEYVAYQNLVTNYLNHRGLLEDLDAGKLLASGSGAPPAIPVVDPSVMSLPQSSDPGLPIPTAVPTATPAAPVIAAFPSQSMQMFDEAEGFNDALFEAGGARSSLEFNPTATPPPPEERVTELPIPPDAELPAIFTAPVAPQVDYDPEFLPLQASIQVDEQVANAAALIASAEPDPSYASGSWSIPSQIQAPLPPLSPAQPVVEQDPYASGSWGALSQIQAPLPTDVQQVHQFSQPQSPFGQGQPQTSPFGGQPAFADSSGISSDSPQPPSPWAAPEAAPTTQSTPVADNPWNPLPGTSTASPSPNADVFGASQPQPVSPYASEPESDKWETGGWATITPPSGSGVNSGASNGGGADSAFGAAAPDQAPSPFQWAAPEQFQNQFQAPMPYQANNEEEEQKAGEDKTGFPPFDPTKAWE